VEEVGGTIVSLGVPILTKNTHLADGSGSLNGMALTYLSGFDSSSYYGSLTRPDIPAWAVHTQKLYASLTGGDSGGPTFLLINKKPVLLNVHYTAFMGPFITNYRAQVEAAMNSLSYEYNLPGNVPDPSAGQYALSQVSLTQFDPI
jgi:hypothetical protein